MGADISTIEDILKEDYRGPIREQLNNKTVLLQHIEKTSEYTSGDVAVVPLHTGRNEGIGARGEDEDLPEAGNQGYDNVRYGMTYHYGRVRFTGPALAKARDDAGAFARLADSEMKGLVRDLLRDFNRQCYTGKSGHLAAVATDTAASATSIPVSDARFFRAGMRVDAVVTATGAAVSNGSNLQVVAVNRKTNTITLAANTANLATTNSFVRKGSVNKEMFGLIDLISTGNAVGLSGAAGHVGAIDRTTAGNEFWQSNVIDHANAQFSQTIFQDMLDKVDIEGDGNIGLFLTTHAIFNSYANTLLPDRRYSSSGSPFSKLDGGYDALDYNGVPVVKDRDCQYNRIYGISLETLMLLEMSDWDWMDKDGAVLARVPNKDAYEATLFKYCELGLTDARDNVVAINVGAA